MKMESRCAYHRGRSCEWVRQELGVSAEARRSMSRRVIDSMFTVLLAHESNGKLEETIARAKRDCSRCCDDYWYDFLAPLILFHLSADEGPISNAFPRTLPWCVAMRDWMQAMANAHLSLWQTRIEDGAYVVRDPFGEEGHHISGDSPIETSSWAQEWTVFGRVLSWRGFCFLEAYDHHVLKGDDADMVVAEIDAALSAAGTRKPSAELMLACWEETLAGMLARARTQLA
jgi:hypothetical protein